MKKRKINLPSLLVVGFVLILFSIPSRAATIQVTTTADELSVHIHTACSLREAIQAIHNGSSSTYTECINSSSDPFGTNDTIMLTSGSTYQIALGTTGDDLNAGGDFDISDSLRITSTDTDVATVSIVVSIPDRIFDISNGATVNFENIKISGGHLTTSSFDGGGLRVMSGAEVTLNHSQVIDNVVGTISTTSEVYGGGVYVEDATLTVTNSTITTNNTYNKNKWGFGGGIYASHATLTLESSTVSSNAIHSESGISTSFGGAVYADDTVFDISNSSITGNSIDVVDSAGAAGGGLALINGTTLTVLNSTFAENEINTYLSSTGMYGGAIFAMNSTTTAELDNVTVTDNTLYSDGSGATGLGAGIMFMSSVSIKLKNSILANNTEDLPTTSTKKDCYGTIDSYGYNLIEGISSCTLSYTLSGADAATDILGEDPVLLTLADNGGQTQTSALDATSPAVDMGSCATIDGSGIPTDQRGYERSDGVCDMGAFEYIGAETSAAMCSDELDNDLDGDVDCSDSDCSSVCTTWYGDDDGDGYGDGSATIVSITQPAGFVENDTDCDDTDANINPGMIEVCGDAIDNNCDGNIDPISDWYADADGDGYGDVSALASSCTQPVGYVSDSSDCDDSNDAIHPTATEVCDGADNNCDGVTDENDAADASTWYIDEDKDGYGTDADIMMSCGDPSDETLTFVANALDCNDEDASVNPGAGEICEDGVDQNCDGTDLSCVVDNDQDDDGYFIGEDCDDTNASIHPGTAEICGDSLDNNCDGSTDEGCEAPDDGTAGIGTDDVGDGTDGITTDGGVTNGPDDDVADDGSDGDSIGNNTSANADDSVAQSSPTSAGGCSLSTNANGEANSMILLILLSISGLLLMKRKLARDIS